MKYKIHFCALLLAAGVSARGDALNEQQVAPDAKWLVHIDCDNLRRTQLGEYLLNKILVPQAAGLSGDLDINVTNILQRISSLTAYGADFKMGPDATSVLLINSDPETQKVLEGLLAAQILADTNGPVKKLENEKNEVYSVANQVFISPKKGGPVVVSKSELQIDATRELLEGKGPTHRLGKGLGDFPAVSNSFFFVAVADALNIPAQIPARAKVLQMADGGRVALGERADQVCLDLSLRGKTVEVTRQIQQVMEGMVALVSLGQPENQDLMDLAKSTKVSSTNQLITISLEYPTTKVIAKLTEEMSPKPKADKPPRQKKKAKTKRPNPPVQEAPADSDSTQPAPDKPVVKPEAEEAKPGN